MFTSSYEDFSEALLFIRHGGFELFLFIYQHIAVLLLQVDISRIASAVGNSRIRLSIGSRNWRTVPNGY